MFTAIISTLRDTKDSVKQRFSAWKKHRRKLSRMAYATSVLSSSIAGYFSIQTLIDGESTEDERISLSLFLALGALSHGAAVAFSPDTNPDTAPEEIELDEKPAEHKRKLSSSHATTSELKDSKDTHDTDETREARLRQAGQASPYSSYLTTAVSYGLSLLSTSSFAMIIALLADNIDKSNDSDALGSTTFIAAMLGLAAAPALTRWRVAAPMKNYLAFHAKKLAGLDLALQSMVLRVLYTSTLPLYLHTYYAFFFSYGKSARFVEKLIKESSVFPEKTKRGGIFNELPRLSSCLTEQEYSGLIQLNTSKHMKQWLKQYYQDNPYSLKKALPLLSISIIGIVLSVVSLSELRNYQGIDSEQHTRIEVLSAVGLMLSTYGLGTALARKVAPQERISFEYLFPYFLIPLVNPGLTLVNTFALLGAGVLSGLWDTIDKDLFDYTVYQAQFNQQIIRKLADSFPEVFQGLLSVGYSKERRFALYQKKYLPLRYFVHLVTFSMFPYMLVTSEYWSQKVVGLGAFLYNPFYYIRSKWKPSIYQIRKPSVLQNFLYQNRSFLLVGVTLPMRLIIRLFVRFNFDETQYTQIAGYNYLALLAAASLPLAWSKFAEELFGGRYFMYVPDKANMITLLRHCNSIANGEETTWQLDKYFLEFIQHALKLHRESLSGHLIFSKETTVDGDEINIANPREEKVKEQTPKEDQVAIEIERESKHSAVERVSMVELQKTPERCQHRQLKVTVLHAYSNTTETPTPSAEFKSASKDLTTTQCRDCKQTLLHVQRKPIAKSLDHFFGNPFYDRAFDAAVRGTVVANVIRYEAPRALSFVPDVNMTL